MSRTFKFNRLKMVEPTKPFGSTKPLTQGTGLTKRLAERSDRAHEKEEEKALTDKSRQIATEKAKQDLQEHLKEQTQVLDIKTPSDIELDEWQIRAVDAVDKHSSYCIIGAAGSGKTTVENEVIKRILKSVPEIEYKKTGLSKEENEEQKVYSIAFCAFTGRAVEQMKRAIDPRFHATCTTIHKLLGFQPNPEEYWDAEAKEYKTKIKFEPTFTAFNKLPYNVIIMDEGSMTPINLWNMLIDACLEGTRFIIIGDINQLPPVMDRSVLPFAMMKWPTFELKKIHRQAADNPIIANAHRVLNGQMPVKDKDNFFIKALGNGSHGASSDILKFVKLLAEHGKFNAFSDGLIVPTNVGELGQEYLNSNLVHYFNPLKKTEQGVALNRRFSIKAARGIKLFAVGDKVMLLANDNDLGLTNGMTGVIVDITRNGNFKDKHLGFHSDEEEEIDVDDLLNFNLSNKVEDEELTKEQKKEENQRQASHITTVKFSGANDDVEIKLSTVGQYAKVSHAYAFTCHKSQGGEYPTVIVAFHSAVGRMLNREWLYTAITRASKTIYLFCNPKALTDALRKQAIKGNSIEEKAQSFIKLMQSTDTTLPILPESKEV